MPGWLDHKGSNIEDLMNSAGPDHQCDLRLPGRVSAPLERGEPKKAQAKNIIIDLGAIILATQEPEDPESCWNKFNRAGPSSPPKASLHRKAAPPVQAFEWLPVGAVIEDRILCLHGGHGSRGE